MRIKSVWLVIAFVCALVACPVNAYASPLDSFTNGLHDFVSPDTETVEEVRYEQDYLERYEPQEIVLYSPSVRALSEDATTVDYVNNTVNAYNTVPWSSTNRSLIDSIRIFFEYGGAGSFAIIVVPAGLVFMWWGVRKSVRMVFAAFRKGRSNV